MSLSTVINTKALAAKLLSVCIASTLAVGCATSTAPGVVGAERRQLLLVSSEEINAMSEQAYNDLKTDAANQGLLNTNVSHVDRVREIGRRIRPHTAVFRQDAPGWNWEANVLESD